MNRREWIQVSACVNDPENGAPTDRVRAVHVDDAGETIELVSPFAFDSEHMVCRIEPAEKKVRFGRRVFPIGGYQHWYGNWCWDGITLTASDTRALIAHLLKNGWTIEGGPVRSSLYPKGVQP